MIFLVSISFHDFYLKIYFIQNFSNLLCIRSFFIRIKNDFNLREITLVAVEVIDGFVGDTFETVVFGTLSLLVAAAVTAVFGLLRVVERDVVADVAVKDLGRDVVDDDTVDVATFDVVVVVSFDAAVVLVAGLDTVLQYQIPRLKNNFTFQNINLVSNHTLH